MSLWEPLLATGILLTLWGVVPAGVVYLLAHGQAHATNRFCTRLCKAQDRGAAVDGAGGQENQLATQSPSTTSTGSGQSAESGQMI